MKRLNIKADKTIPTVMAIRVIVRTGTLTAASFFMLMTPLVVLFDDDRTAPLFAGDRI
jgi:hypothetical protein